MGSRIKPRGSTPFKRLQADLDDLHGKIIRTTGPCFVCRSTYVECVHIFSRNHYNTRWDLPGTHPINCLPGCRMCHSSDHNGSGIFKAAYIRLFGDAAYDALTLRANTRRNYTIPELIELRKHMRELLRRRIANGRANR